jgi:hypothetical protein
MLLKKIITIGVFGWRWLFAHAPRIAGKAFEA